MRPGPRLVTVTVEGWLHPTTQYKDGHCAPTEEALWPRGAQQVHTFLGGTLQAIECWFIYFHFISVVHLNGSVVEWMLPPGPKLTAPILVLVSDCD